MFKAETFLLIFLLSSFDFNYFALCHC